MWIVTKIGFFNIIQQDSDENDEILTIKARSRADLEYVMGRIPVISNAIEESDKADYRFRIKAYRADVMKLIGHLVSEIDYGKTKPAITEKFPERAGTYLNVWDDLYAIQETHRS
jgi:hypothetical protein